MIDRQKRHRISRKHFATFAGVRKYANFQHVRTPTSNREKGGDQTLRGAERHGGAYPPERKGTESDEHRRDETRRDEERRRGPTRVAHRGAERSAIR